MNSWNKGTAYAENGDPDGAFVHTGQNRLAEVHASPYRTQDEAEAIADQIVRDHNRTEAFEAMREALERLHRVASVELTGKRNDVLEQAKVALALAGKE